MIEFVETYHYFIGKKRKLKIYPRKEVSDFRKSAIVNEKRGNRK